MKMKSKPKKPTNPIKLREIDVNHWCVEDIIERIITHNVDIKSTSIYAEMEYDYGDDTPTVRLAYHQNQFTDEEYLEELKKYEKKLQEYSVWYEENREEIEKELEERKRKDILKKQKEKARIEKQLADLNKKLKQYE